MNAVLLCVSVGIAMFLLIVAGAVLAYDHKIKGTRYQTLHPGDWLFSGFDDQVYTAFFKEKDPDRISKKIGLDLDQYYRNCELVREPPNTKRIDVFFLYGMFSLIVCAILAIATKFYYILILGILAFAYFVYYQQNKEKRKANQMRNEIEEELPRFLDLLQTELDVGMPIEIAIPTLCRKMDTLLSREFLESLNAMKLGASGWQESLENLAAKYDVETLNDFVLNVNTAYSRGVDIADVVTQKAKDIKNTRILGVKERAGKATNTILLPIALCQIVPMIAFLMVPALGSVLNGL